PFTGNLLTDNGEGSDTGFMNTLYAVAGTYSTTQGGTITIGANGDFSYTSASLFGGFDSFTYTVNDGYGTIDTATVNFDVNISIAGTSGSDSLSGTSGNDLIFGFEGNDSLNGYDGNDTLDGGLGIDTMAGGAGDDTYIVDNISDSITESASSGNDTVQSSVTYTLSANVENLVL